MAGAEAGSTLSRTSSTTQVTVGAKEAEVLFADLAPGFVGLYQVNATLPTGVSPGSAVPVIITVGGQTSPPFAIAFQ